MYSIFDLQTSLTQRNLNILNSLNYDVFVSTHRQLCNRVFGWIVYLKMA
jgi:hypothetical protein